MTAGIGLKRLQHLVLWVSDVDRSVRFYEDVLGFEVKRRYPNAAFLKIPGSADDHNHCCFYNYDSGSHNDDRCTDHNYRGSYDHNYGGSYDHRSPHHNNYCDTDDHNDGRTNDNDNSSSDDNHNSSTRHR